MAVQGDGGAKEEIKTQFSTIEGVYKILPIPDYSRPNRVVYNNSGSCISSPPVKVSFICLPDSSVHRPISNSFTGHCVTGVNLFSGSEMTNICYNYGRDLYVYSYRNFKKDSDLPKPIEKRSYNKEDVPTCHDFNATTATIDRVLLLVGLLGGQVQLFDPITKEVNKSYNSGEKQRTFGTAPFCGTIDFSEACCHFLRVYLLVPYDWRPVSIFRAVVTVVVAGSLLEEWQLRRLRHRRSVKEPACEIAVSGVACSNSGKGRSRKETNMHSQCCKIIRLTCTQFGVCGTGTNGPVLSDQCILSGRLIDKSKVTCIRWIPNSPNQFLVSHSSGHLYMYNEELVCGLDRPSYQLFKQGEGYSIYTCKTKSTRNPLYRWSVGEGSINEFNFSPCSKFLAIVSQDGFLRVFNFDTMDLVGSARSYYGGLLCVCWSPDGKYAVTGGEDDLVTVWSFHEKRVVARGQGHKSWVTVVAFDPYTTIFTDLDQIDSGSCNDEKSKNSYINDVRNGKTSLSSNSSNNSNRNSLSSDGLIVNTASYRLGSVGQDTLLCLWDLKDDFMRQPYIRPRSSTFIGFKKKFKVGEQSHNVQQTSCSKNSIVKSNNIKEISVNNDHAFSSNSFTAKLANLNFGDKKDKEKCEKDHKRSLSLASKTSSSNCKSVPGKVNIVSGGNSHNSVKIVGTAICPRLDECLMLEPMVCKKIGHERLCGLIFREDSIITSCQDGCILTWCRPGVHMNQHSNSSPTALIKGGNSVNSGGTVV